MSTETFGTAPDDPPSSPQPTAGDRSTGEPTEPSQADIPERFKETLSALDDVPQRPVAEHAQVFDDVHQQLRQHLDAPEG